MNYDFLQNYNIPVVSQTTDNRYVESSHSTMEGAYGTYSLQSSQDIPAVNPAYYGYGDPKSYTSPTKATGNSFAYQYSDRFNPPSNYGTGNTAHKNLFKRKHNGVSGGSAAKKEVPIAEITDDGKSVIFLGRDKSYPDTLNSMIHPLSCDLCDVKMNSRIIAKDHYESKVHDRHISSWLLKNYTEKGLEPPAIKRFIKQGPCGPEAFYCEFCDLKLTSLTHANQHFAGKKHRSVLSQRAKPSGKGFYNAENKWVRTGTKGTPNSSQDQRFGIGESFRLAEVIASTENINNTGKSTSNITDTVTSAADTTTKFETEVKSINFKASKNASTTNPDQDPALFCSICKVNVTSAVQMTMHLSGSKHMKRLKACGLIPTEINKNVDSPDFVLPSETIMDNVLFSAIKEEIKPDATDLSVYRTPSGQYYCKTCNISMSHLPGLEQHLKGKRHLKNQIEEKAMACLAAKKK